MRIAILSIIIGCLSLNAEARIGETLAQCTARYGGQYLPLNLKDGTHTYYQKNGFCILVLFYKGKADSIIYSKADKTKLTESEIEWFKKLNAGDRKWVRWGEESERAFRTEDKDVYCVYNPDNGLLSIISGDSIFRDAGAALQKEAKAAAAKEGKP